MSGRNGSSELLYRDIIFNLLLRIIILSLDDYF